MLKLTYAVSVLCAGALVFVLCAFTAEAGWIGTPAKVSGPEARTSLLLEVKKNRNDDEEADNSDDNNKHHKKNKHTDQTSKDGKSKTDKPDSEESSDTSKSSTSTSDAGQSSGTPSAPNPQTGQGTAVQTKDGVLLPYFEVDVNKPNNGLGTKP